MTSDQTRRDELIASATKAIAESAGIGLRWEQVAPMTEAAYRSMAEAALAVFEQAHTPTDDEREALVAEARKPQGAFAKANLVPALADALEETLNEPHQGVAPSVEEWAKRAHAAREKASAKGYTPEHDAKHGVRHLLNWAIDYARRGRAEDSSGLILSALALLGAEPQAEPTDDEREALARALFIASDDFAVADRMAKAWDAPGSHGRARWYRYADAVLAAGFRRTVQGEPTDAQVEAAMREHDYSLDRETTRNVLRAAAAIHEGEPR